MFYFSVSLFHIVSQIRCFSCFKQNIRSYSLCRTFKPKIRIFLKFTKNLFLRQNGTYFAYYLSKFNLQDVPVPQNCKAIGGIYYE